MQKLLFIAGLLMLPAIGHAQQYDVTRVQAAPSGVTTTQTNGTLSPTPGTFVSVLAANPSMLRKDCTLYNRDTSTIYVFFGPTANATMANSIPLGAGLSINCSHGLAVNQDNVAAASSATASAPYVLLVQ